ncbi:MAG: hypothetical protein AAFV62_07390 [Pseudomonadota bacterium]
MKTIFSDDHRLHFPQAELCGGELVTPFERPSRVEYILRELNARGMSDISAPDPLDWAPVRKIHDAGYLRFLETVWEDWVAAGYRGEVIPTGFPLRRLRQDKIPNDIDGKAGYYAMATETAITAGTWAAAQASASVAQTAQRLVAGGERAAFALCRPPGHHASYPALPSMSLGILS